MPLPKLREQTNFKEDVEKFQQKISSINNLKKQKLFQKKLDEFISHANLIDNGHDTYNGGYIKPINLRDNIISMIEIRRELELLLKT